MRITFVLSRARLAGGTKVIATYAKIFQDRGHEVVVVSIPPRQATVVDQFKAMMRGRAVPPRRLGYGPSHLDGLGLDWRVLEKPRPVVDSDVPDADIVFAAWWETAEWVSRLSPSKGVKAYFIQHHEVHDGQPKERVAATWRLPLHKITISKWLSDINENRYGLGPIPVIHNSVDLEQFHAVSRSRNEPPVIGLLYSGTYWKGVRDSFSAIEAARREFPEARVVLFGAHEECDDLPLPSNSQLHVRPEQDAIRDIYGACDYWLCGSLAEGFHLPPLEAMACRLPVVSTAVGGPVDIIRPGVNGFLSPPGEPQLLAANLSKALSMSHDEWRAMSEAAYATARDYTWEDAADRFEQEMHRIVSRGQLSAAE